jgi:predicted transcriptional regulator
MARGKSESVRFHMSLDEEHKAKLDRLAEQAYTPPITLARSLLSRAIDDADVDGATITDILLGIPGAVGRVTRAEEQLARGEGIPLDQL